jgi:hypothetical protein
MALHLDARLPSGFRQFILVVIERVDREAFQRIWRAEHQASARLVGTQLTTDTIPRVCGAAAAYHKRSALAADAISGACSR